MILTLLITLCTLTLTTSSKNSREEEFSRIKHYELIEINTNLFQSAKIIDFTVFNQYYKIQLIPNEDLIPSKLRHTSMKDIHNKPEQHEYFKSFHETCHYFGNVLNTNTHSIVSLSLCPKRGIRGRITAFNQTILIKPSAHYFDFKNAISKGHDIADEVLVYKISDFDLTNIGEPHGINMFPKNKNGKQSMIKANDNVIHGQRRRLYSSSNPATVELLIINGPERTQRFENDYGSSAWYSALYSDIADIVNQVSQDYLNTNWGSYIGGLSSVKVKWVELEVIFAFSDIHYRLAPNWLRTTCMTSYQECAINGRGWLSTISTWLYSRKDTSTFDNVQLISDIAFAPNTAGWGNVGQVCQGTGSVSDISEQWGHDYVIKTMAHELGHNLGMPHDGDAGCNTQTDIMGAGYDTFSSCSINSFRQYMSEEAGLTCLGRHQSGFTSNYNGDGGQIPPTTSTTRGPYPTLRPTQRPTSGDTSGEWTCFGLRNMIGFPTFNGMWGQSGTFAGKISYAKSGFFLYFHADWEWWLISPNKGSTAIKGYCRNSNLQLCAGGTSETSFRTLASTGWEYELSGGIYDCDDTGSTPTPRPTVRPTVRPTSGGTAPTPTPRPTVRPTPPPVGEVNLPCTYHDCLQISSMELDSDGRSYNGRWSPAGCHNGQAYYHLNGNYDRKLCFSTYNMWMIAEGLCPSGRTIGYSPQSGSSQVTSTQNNWNILGSGGWDLDRGVTLTPCGGAPFIDNTSLCIENNEYNNNLCIYNNNTLWNGEWNFELHPNLCSKGKPVYRYIIYDESESMDDEYDDIATDKNYNNIQIINTYYLHYYEEKKYSDGDEMVGKWIITLDEITLKAMAICEKENLIECNVNEWIIDTFYNGQDEEEDINGTDFSINDGWFQKEIDQYMMISNNKCGADKEESETSDDLLKVIIIAIGALVLIGCVIGCCIWQKREKSIVKRQIQKVSTTSRKQLSDLSDDENDDDDGYDDDGYYNGNTNNTMQLNQEIIVTAEMPVDDDEVGTPLTTTYQ